MYDFPPAGVVDARAQWLAFTNLEQEEKLRAFTESGRPAGGAGFVKKREGLPGRPLAARRRGRPREKGEKWNLVCAPICATEYPWITRAPY